MTTQWVWDMSVVCYKPLALIHTRKHNSHTCIFRWLPILAWDVISEDKSQKRGMYDLSLRRIYEISLCWKSFVLVICCVCQNMVAEWAWPDEAGVTRATPSNNDILGHVVLRLRNIVHPPVVDLSSPTFCHCPLKACVLGKFCSGKTTCLAKISKGMLSKHTKHNLTRLNYVFFVIYH